MQEFLKRAKAVVDAAPHLDRKYLVLADLIHKELSAVSPLERKKKISEVLGDELRRSQSSNVRLGAFLKAKVGWWRHVSLLFKYVVDMLRFPGMQARMVCGRLSSGRLSAELHMWNVVLRGRSFCILDVQNNPNNFLDEDHCSDFRPFGPFDGLGPYLPFGATNTQDPVNVVSEIQSAKSGKITVLEVQGGLVAKLSPEANITSELYVLNAVAGMEPHPNIAGVRCIFAGTVQGKPLKALVFDKFQGVSLAVWKDQDQSSVGLVKQVLDCCYLSLPLL